MKSDSFNFYGLDKIDHPLSNKTIERMLNESSLKLEEVQESVWRFSRYYFSHQEIIDEIKNPVGFLRSHLKNFETVFVEPEWWLESMGKIEKGEDRFSRKTNIPKPFLDQRSLQEKQSLPAPVALSSFFSELLSSLQVDPVSS